MITFDLYNDVIVDFSTDETFTRLATSIDNIGREVNIISQTKVLFVYPHPATDADLREVSSKGYHIEDMIKIFAKVDADIQADDIIIYIGLEYRVMKTNVKLVGDYSKFFAELTDQNSIPDITSEDFIDELGELWLDEGGEQWVS